jgi:hypothetical protein
MSRQKIISYSQYSNWLECRYRWYLDYVKKLRSREGSIAFSFGNAMHSVVQNYVKTLYTDGMISASMLDLKEIFIDSFVNDLYKTKIIVTTDELSEYVKDGGHLIDEFSNIEIKNKYFPPDKYEFVGAETELKIQQIHNVEYWGFLDLVLLDKKTGRYKIFDLKTSTFGWNKYQKEDITKTSQLVLYKLLFSSAYKIPSSKIDVEFLILKRKLYENTKYNQSRFQSIIPKSDLDEMNWVSGSFNEFIVESFNKNGTYKEDGTFYKNPGKNKSNCKYCIHKNVNCNAKIDKIDKVNKIII